MEEDHGLVLEPACPRQRDQPLHRLAGIDRVQHDAVGAGGELQRLDHRLVDQAVTGADIVAVGHDHGVGDRVGTAQQGGGLTRQLQDVGLLFVLRRTHPDAEHRDVGAHDGQTGDEARMGPGAARRGDDAVDGHVELIGLDHDLAGAVGVTQRADRVGAAAGDYVRLAAALAHSLGRDLELDRHVRAAGDAADRGVEQPVEQDVAVARIVGGLGARAFLEDDLAFQPVRGRRRRRLAHMVGLDRALGHQRVGALFEGVAEQELQLARLVAAAREAGAVIALDPQLDAQRLGQTRQRLQRRRQMGETNAGKAGEVHGVKLRFANPYPSRRNRHSLQSFSGGSQMSG